MKNLHENSINFGLLKVLTRISINTVIKARVRPLVASTSSSPICTSPRIQPAQTSFRLSTVCLRRFILKMLQMQKSSLHNGSEAQSNNPYLLTLYSSREAVKIFSFCFNTTKNAKRICGPHFEIERSDGHQRDPGLLHKVPRFERLDVCQFQLYLESHFTTTCREYLVGDLH